MKRSSISNFSDPNTLAELAAHLERNGVAALHIEAPDGDLKLVTPVRTSRPAAHHAAPAAVPVSRTQNVLAKAPTAGIFTSTHPLRPERDSAAGSAVSKGDIVAFVRVGPVLVPVTAEKAGTVASVTTEAGTLVGYGTSLFTART